VAKLSVTKEQLIKRLQNKKQLESFVNKIESVLIWVTDNPENSDNIPYSATKESVRGHLAAAWEGY
jgi:hypothetical protein